MKNLAIVVIILVVGLLGFVFLGGDINTSPTPETSQEQDEQVENQVETENEQVEEEQPEEEQVEEEQTQAEEESNNVVIEITENGYTPSNITISQGTTVTFVNNDTDGHWPASNIHPTHRVYPGSDITKCGTAEEDNIFDACGELQQGESWSFTFNEVGTWAYHDHLRSSLGGTIVVE